MRRNLRGFAATYALSLALAAPVAEAQKSGGVLIMSHFDSPASMSMREEATGAVNRPMMGVFNNLGHISAGCGAKQYSVDRSGLGDRLVVDTKFQQLAKIAARPTTGCRD